MKEVYRTFDGFIRLIENEDLTLTVHYGLSKAVNLQYEKAAKELGLSILHHLSAEGKLSD